MPSTETIPRGKRSLDAAHPSHFQPKKSKSTPRCGEAPRLPLSFVVRPHDPPHSHGISTTAAHNVGSHGKLGSNFSGSNNINERKKKVNKASTKQSFNASLSSNSNLNLNGSANANQDRNGESNQDCRASRDEFEKEERTGIKRKDFEHEQSHERSEHEQEEHDHDYNHEYENGEEKENHEEHS